MNPTISVIVSVYNRFELTRRAVDSVLAQTLPVSEVLLIDDGSFDGTSELLPRYIETNAAWRERVHYSHQENQGPGVARNNGIAKARGEWLAFIDNDDLWLPQKLEWQFRALDQFKNECDACITDAWFMNNPYMKMTLFQLAGRQHTEMVGMISDPLNYMLKRQSIVGVHPIWVPTLITRSELARNLGGFDPQLGCGEDDDFVFRLGCKAKFCFVNMPMVLIDRTPPSERHFGASTSWDKVDFRLRMAQRRYEKRLRMSERLPDSARNAIRRDLAAVHSAWASWFLQNKEYDKARKAVAKAARIHLTAGIALKQVLAQCAPRLARKIVLLRDENRNRKSFGLG